MPLSRKQSKTVIEQNLMFFIGKVAANLRDNLHATYYLFNTTNTSEDMLGH